MKIRWALLFIYSLCTVAWAYDPAKPAVTGHEMPKEIQGLGVEEHLGDTIDLSMEFVADTGEKVTLGKYFQTGHPVLLAMVYYNCPNLCNLHLNGIVEALKNLKWSPGQEFRVVAVSMDHTENATLASTKKANYVKSYGRPETINGWHFLTGTEANVKKLADQLGFKFRWMEDTKQFSHAAVAYVITPGGKISRYIYGIAPETQTLKLSLLEASNGKIGSVVDQILLYCFHFDPTKNKYTVYAWNLMRLGGALMLFVVAIVLIPLWRKEVHNGTA